MPSAAKPRSLPFLHVLGDDLGLPAEGIDVHKGDLFLGLAGLGLPGAVDRQAELAMAVPLGVYRNSGSRVRFPRG